MCIRYLNSHADDLWCPDQDVLNAVLKEYKLMLPLTYNFQIQFFKYDIFDSLPEYIKTDVLQMSTPPLYNSLCICYKTMDDALS